MEPSEEHDVLDFSQRRRRTPRVRVLMPVLLTCSAFGLGTGGPALASGWQAPPPVAPALPGPPSLPELALPPEVVVASAAPPLTPAPISAPDPAIAVEAQSDGSNLNVAVRVDSARESGETPGRNGGAEVVSPPAAAGITVPPSSDATAPAAVEAPTQERASNGAPAAPQPVLQSGAANTNVSVRVASPGDNGAVEQTAASAAPKPAAQYHGGIPQYQSEGNSGSPEVAGADNDAWIWVWKLANCGEDTTSTSVESGSPASRDWTWNWSWNWSCDTAPADMDATPVPAVTPARGGDDRERSDGAHGGPANVNVAIRVLSPGDDGPVLQSSASAGSAVTPPSSDQSWLWVWTFSWCGEAMEVTTRAGQGSGLAWAWSWSWYWPCAAEEQGDIAAPAPLAATAPEQETAAEEDGVREAQASVVVPAAPFAAPLAVDGESVLSLDWLDWPEGTLAASSRAGLEASRVGSLGASWLGVVPSVPEVPTAATTWPVPTPTIDVAVIVSTASVQGARGAAAIAFAVPNIEIAIGFEPGGTDAGRPQPAASRPKADGRRTEGRAGAETSGGPAGAGAPRAQATVGRGEDDARPSARATSRGDSGLPAAPDFPPLQVAGSAGASGGGGASGVLLVGIAALTGLFVLAVPGLGRRIRLARHPRPRSRDGSSIDHPG